MEQFSLLDPTLVETPALALVYALREAYDEVVVRGVPADAARDFLLGHLAGEIAVVFDEIDHSFFSEGAVRAATRARQRVMREDWKGIFETEEILSTVSHMTASEPAR